MEYHTETSQAMVQLTIIKIMLNINNHRHLQAKSQIRSNCPVNRNHPQATPTRQLR